MQQDLWLIMSIKIRGHMCIAYRRSPQFPMHLLIRELERNSCSFQHKESTLVFSSIMNHFMVMMEKSSLSQLISCKSENQLLTLQTDFLKDKGIFDQDSFVDYIKEESE